LMVLFTSACDNFGCSSDSGSVPAPDEAITEVVVEDELQVVEAAAPIVAEEAGVNSPPELKPPSKVVSLSGLYTDIVLSSGFNFTDAPLPPGLIAVSGAAPADVPSSLARVDANDSITIAALKPDMIIIDCLSFGSRLSPEDFEAKAEQFSDEVNEKNAGSNVDLVFSSNALTQKALDQEVNRFGNLFKIDNLVKVLSDTGETTPSGRRIYPPADSPTATCALPAPTEPTPAATTPAAPTPAAPTDTQPPFGSDLKNDTVTHDTECLSDATGFKVNWQLIGDLEGPQPGVVLESGSQEILFDDDVLNGRGEVNVTTGTSVFSGGSIFIGDVPVPSCNTILPILPTPPDPIPDSPPGDENPEVDQCEEMGLHPDSQECADFLQNGALPF
jgi:hypothetical protein